MNFLYKANNYKNSHIMINGYNHLTNVFAALSKLINRILQHIHSHNTDVKSMTSWETTDPRTTSSAMSTK